MKSKWAAWLIIAILILIPLMAWAVDLEKPGGKKVTIKSEIQRGHEAAYSAGGGMSFDLLNDLEAISRVFSINKQKNTDSPGFLLGASFGAWSSLSSKLDILKGKVAKDDYDLAYKEAVDYFKDFRKMQKQLKINDQTLMEIVGGKKPLEDRIYLWESKIKK